ncbi:hypothetical protein [Thermococcus camini]|uniref:Uncharacterized protein n=1 Tax=Thermococcus camini TaxID=2016373 RepID=A0A7G2D962_9EURY|nr:hypothetical protein [Thermococcus camini]CAD5244179.1 protein of unknown function [Thermococcus camini]
MSLKGNFWLFAIGRFISQLGWAVKEVALPLYVLDKAQNGSSAATGTGKSGKTESEAFT